MERERALLVQADNFQNALEIFETSCTVILRNEGEDIPLDTFAMAITGQGVKFGKAAALAHYLKLLPYRIEVTGYLAEPPSPPERAFLYGGPGPRPSGMVEQLRKMANERTTYIYVTPSYNKIPFDDLIIEEAVITAQNQAHNIYEVRLQLKSVLFYNSLMDAVTTAANVFGKLAPLLVPAGAIAGAALGAALAATGIVSAPIGTAALIGGLGGAALGFTVSSVAAVGAGVLNFFGILPTIKGSLPWQKYTVPLGDIGDYDIELYGKFDGFPLITVSKNGEVLVKERPVIIGQNILGEVQHHPYAKDIYFVPVPLVEGVTEVTNENLGKQTGILAFSCKKLRSPEEIPAGIPVYDLQTGRKVR